MRSSKLNLRSVVASVITAALFVGLCPLPSYAAADSANTTVKVAPITALQDGKRQDFVMGADVSELYAIEQSGKKFYDTNGQEMSALQVMKNHGVNYIRLRVWNDPTDKFGNPIGGGNTDLASAIVTAKAAKQLNMGVLLDFHYSDFWADPGSQVKPKAWTNHAGATLQQDVYDFTFDSLQAMKAAGALPDMVQIGNEINPGLLLPDGSSATKAAPFLQKASAAVRAVDPAIQIMIHLAGNSNGSVSSFTGNFGTWTSGATAVDFDIIGISDYPFWHGTMAQNKTILETLASTYNKKVVVAETSYGWTLDESDEQLNTFGQAQATAAGYTPTVQGQAAEVRDIINNVANVPDSKGLGVFYWGAAWLPGVDTGWITGQGSGWENQALFDYSGKALPSLDVFNQVRSSEAAPAATLIGTDPVYVTATVGSTLTLPATVQGQYSDGLYKSVTVSTWDQSAVDLNKQGIYKASGTINGTAGAAQAVITVGPAQPTNLITTNPGFEVGSATGWTVESPLAVKKNASDAHAGSYALHFSSTATAKTAYRTITGLANGTYTYSIWAEAYGVDASAADISIFAKGHDALNSGSTVTQSVSITAWGSWKQYSVSVPVTSGQVTIGVSVKGNSGLYGDFDDSYFGLPAVAGDGSTAVLPVTATAIDGTALADGASIPAGVRYVKLATSTPGARIYYTTDGNTPAYASGSSATLYYAGPIEITGNTVIKAYAVVPGYASSPLATYNFKADYSSGPTLVPGGDFETAGLSEWTLEGAEKGNNEGVYTFEANSKGTFAGENAFNYYAAAAYSFKLSQKVTGLPNGKYTLSAYSSGQSNLLTGTDGRYTNDASIASLALTGSTPATQKSTNVLNQGWNVWQPYQVKDLYVTDGTLTISFGGAGSAGYWGYLDHVTLEKTGAYPEGSITGKVQDNAGQPVAGALISVGVNGSVYGSATTDVQGRYSVAGILAGPGTAYTVTASKSGYTNGSSTGIQVVEATATEGVNLVLTGSPAVSGITLNTEEAPSKLTVGDTYVLVAKVAPSDATIKNVQFVSEDEDIASVTGVTYDALTGTTSATVTAISEGDGVIIARALDGGSEAAYRFQVVQAAIPDVTPPAEVSDVKVIPGDQSLTVQWQDPTDNDLAKIRVSVVGNPLVQPVIVNKGIQQAVITGLVNGTEYSLLVTTEDLTGNVSTGTVWEGTPAAASTGGEGQSADKHALQAEIVSVQALHEADYTAESWADLQAAWNAAAAVNANEDATQAQVDGVLASLRTAVSALVAIEAPTEDTTAPGEVTAVQVTAGNGTLTLAWQDPTDSDLSQVKVVIQGEGGTAPVLVAKGVQQTTLTGLTNGAVYTLLIQTIDASGNVSNGVEASGTPYDSGSVYVPPVTVPAVTPSPVTVDRNGIATEVKPDASGQAKAIILAADLKRAIDAAEASTLRVKISPAAGTGEVNVTLPMEQLIEAVKSKKLSGLSIDTGFGTVTLDTAWLTAQGVSNSQLQLSMKLSDVSTLSDAARLALNGQKVYDFTLSVDGKKLEQFEGNQVKVELPYTLKAAETANRVIVYYMNEAGTLEPVKNAKYNAETGKVVFSPKHFSKYAAAYSQASFLDLGHVSWAREGIEALAARDAVHGIGGGSFNPNGTVTRAEFITMLMNTFDLSAKAAASSTFSDVKADLWYTDAIASAQQWGIVSGKADGSFGIQDAITRQEMAIMIYRMAKHLGLQVDAGVQAIAFTDEASIADYAKEAVQAMQAAGIVNGSGNGAFDPLAKSTRAQAAVMMYRLFQKV